jgi:nucleoside-diphosphate-sugar epimerase
MTANPLARDLDHVLARMGGLWEDLRGARIFVTGGTGFVGCWLLETFLWANDRHGLGASAVVLTRNANAFRVRVSHLAAHPAVTLHGGDVRTFEFPDGAFTHVVHTAVDTSGALHRAGRLLEFDTTVDGTRRTLEFARRAGATRFLLTSSGSVYGKQPPDLMHLPEEYPGAPDPMREPSAGAEAKRAAEMLCILNADARLEPTVARCFSFIGPYLPLDDKFAAGNFIRDALNGGLIEVSGDGTPYRSYLYAADLAIWLWAILLRGQARQAYNVGSEEAVSIADLAHLVAGLTGHPEVRVAQAAPKDRPAARYVPSTARARRDLGLAVTVDLREALARTIEWNRC